MWKGWKGVEIMLGNGCAFILVLFILLVIIACCCGWEWIRCLVKLKPVSINNKIFCSKVGLNKNKLRSGL